MDRAILERLREESGLSIDEEGRFLHRGEPITHRRTLEVLWGSLERADDGRYRIRVGREAAWVRLADAPYAVRAVQGDPPRLALSDGTEEPFRPETLRLGRDGVLRCLVKGDHRARFTRAAQVALGLAMEEDSSSPSGFSLRVAGRRLPVPLE
ncbi:MAG TPA: hypothetical protein VFR85_12725 [Anaeromyxobacteraceae bacterium]|nr:hypothetical protein [Anaeromyxobacteraceae bacterium]